MTDLVPKYHAVISRLEKPFEKVFRENLIVSDMTTTTSNKMCAIPAAAAVQGVVLSLPRISRSYIFAFLYKKKWLQQIVVYEKVFTIVTYDLKPEKKNGRRLFVRKNATVVFFYFFFSYPLQRIFFSLLALFLRF